MSRGFWGVGIFHGKRQENLGGLFRSAQAFGASFMYTIGTKYIHQSTDTCNATKNIPYFHYENLEDYRKHSPKDCQLVVVELDPKAHCLNKFIHPQRASYLLGSESGNLPKELLEQNIVVQIPSKICLNVATAGSIVMYSRISKNGS